MVVRSVNWVLPDLDGNVDTPQPGTGPQGPQGIQGIEGPQGVAGPQGPTGPQGTVGPQGLQGEQGVQGPVGPQGPQGLTGPQGAQGPIGPQGEQGLRGLTGSQGVAGPQGIQGVAGPVGPRGASGALWVNDPTKQLKLWSGQVELTGNNGQFSVDYTGAGFEHVISVQAQILGSGQLQADFPIAVTINDSYSLTTATGKAFKATSAGLLAAMQQTPAEPGTKVNVLVFGY